MWTTVREMLPYRDLITPQQREKKIFPGHCNIIYPVSKITVNGTHAGRASPLLVL